MTTISQAPKNARGIPAAPFITDIPSHIGPNGDAETVLKEFQDALAKYRYMEQNLLQRRAGLEDKIPDIRKTLGMVKALANKGKEPMRTTFELNETLFAHADVELAEGDEVFLWLGANVMLSYPVQEAQDLLQSKLESAEKSLESVISDGEFVKEQITIVEVNVARVYNWDVKRRREERAAKEITI
ncbi:Prefoldin subunit 3 [Mycena floridula]|nr:Prefoldin subunit 3 [Mycena floridula]